MTIYYSPFYSSGCHTDLDVLPGKTLFDGICVNDAGLLSQLELRLGLSRPDAGNAVRLVDYFKAVSSTMKEENPLSTSWNTDPLGTSRQCLEWRDALVMSGWDASLPQPDGRLKLLADIEKKFSNTDSWADRWHCVLKALKNGEAALAAGSRIIVGLNSKDAVQPQVLNVLSLLEAQGTVIEYSQVLPQADSSTDLGKFQRALAENAGKLELKGDGTLQVLRFDSESEAQRYLVAMHDAQTSPLYIARNTLGLDYAQRMLGRGTSGSSVSTMSAQEMQLLPLAVELWSGNYNIRALMQWLQVRVHPLPPGLRRKLTYVLSRQGGYENEYWDEAIRDWLESECEDRTKYEERLKWALPHNEGKEIDKKSFADFVTRLKQWADGRRHLESRKDALLARQLAELSNALGAMLLLIDGVEAEVLDYIQLKQWASILNVSVEYDMGEMQLDGMRMIQHPGDIRSGVCQLFWTDCYNADTRKADSDFLNSTERGFLDQQGCLLSSTAVWLQAEQQTRINAVMYTSGQLTLIIADQNAEGATTMHPLIIRLKQLVGEDVWKTLVKRPVTDEGKLSEMPAIHNELSMQPCLEIQNGELIKMCDHESYTSLDNLVNHPLDYLMEKILKLDTMRDDSLDEKNKIMGNVAHRVIQKLFIGTNEDIEKAVDEKYSSTFDTAVKEKGALLLLPENKLELTRMKGVLRKSIAVLLEIIRGNHLKVIATEMEIDGDFSLGEDETLRITGQADMVLEKPDEQWVVFDFKWSASKNWYRTLLEEDTSLQLALYKEMLGKKGHKVSDTAYYQLPVCTLLTQSETLKGDNVNRVAVKNQNENDLISQLRNSYRYRRGQFADGKIDNGDLMELEATSYGCDQAEKGLLALGTDKKKIKSDNKFTHFKLFKTPLK